MFLGLARGSVGDITFYRRNAQQISRVRVRKVKNPQTSAQMWQRAINNTAVEAYSVLKKICDHSFQGVTYGAASYSKFLSLNMDMLRAQAALPAEDNDGQRAYVPFGFKGISAMPFIISQGSIPQPNVEFSTATIEGSDWEGVKLFSMTSATVQTFTYKNFADAIGAQEGDQITVLCVPDPKVYGGVDEPLGLRLLDARVILSPSEGSFDETPFFVENFGTLVVNKPNVRNEGKMIFFADTNDMLHVCPDVMAVDNVGFAFIISRQNPDGSWLRSSSVFLYNPLYRENGYTIKQASTLTPVDLYVEDEKYLNNAE